LESITLENLQENFDEVMERVSDGESFIILVEGEERCVLVPYREYNDLMEDDSVKD